MPLFGKKKDKDSGGEGKSKMLTGKSRYDMKKDHVLGT